MLKKWFLPLLLLLVVAAAVLLVQRWRDSHVPTTVEESVPVKHYTLQNGMTLVVLPNSRVPAVTQMVWVKAGGADDPRNMLGLAHFLEHMMFTGTPNFPEGQYDEMVRRHGGEHNAFTTYDYTVYYSTVAREQLETVMMLEADRLQHIQFTKQKAQREIKVIEEERKMRVDNRPYARLQEQMSAVQFLSHPYGQPLIGWPDSIKRYTPDAARAFYKRFYRPSNLVLVVAGDVDPAEVRSLAGKYFGTIAEGAPPTRTWLPEQPTHTERRVVLRDASVKQPRLVREITVPSLGTEKDLSLLFGFEVYAQLLGGDNTSMLYRRLVREQGLATLASAYIQNSQRGPGTLVIDIRPAQGVSIEAAEEALQRVLKEMAATPPEARDIARAKTQLAAQALFAQDGLSAMANIIGELYALGFDESYFYHWQERVHAVSASDILRAAKQIETTPAVTGVLQGVAHAE